MWAAKEGFVRPVNQERSDSESLLKHRSYIRFIAQLLSVVSLLVDVRNQHCQRPALMWRGVI